MKFKYFIFDWDGTVMDSAAKIVTCMQKAAPKATLAIPTEQAVENIIGISLKPAVMQLFGINDKKADELIVHYKKCFLEEDKTASPLFPNAFDTLEKLSKQAVLGVATGKARRGLQRVWEQTNTEQFFDASRCADDAESKPSSDMLLQLIEQWGIDASEAIMIGDTVYDMQMAENIGMPRLAVSYGVHSTKDLAKHSPLAIIDDISQVLDYL